MTKIRFRQNGTWHFIVISYLTNNLRDLNFWKCIEYLNLIIKILILGFRAGQLFSTIYTVKLYITL